MLRVKTNDEGDTFDVEEDVAHTIEAIDSDDLIVVNQESRTWEVTDVVDRDLADTDDDRLSKRAVRLKNGRKHQETLSIVALVLEEYPDGYEGGLHVLRANNWYEKNQVLEVTSVEILEALVPWVVVRNSGDAGTFHFPDATAAARGEAVPACGGFHGQEPDDGDYRLTRVNTVFPAKRPCIDCARREQTRELPELACPDCGRLIGDGLLQGRGVSAIDGVAIECPTLSCDFEGVIELDATTQNSTTAEVHASAHAGGQR